jgi:hypothetical protein
MLLWKHFLISADFTENTTVTKKIPKANTTQINGFQYQLEGFMKKSAKIVDPSIFWKPFDMGTSGIRKFFCDSTGSFLGSLILSFTALGQLA